jgi:hypothetical protein
MPHLARACCGAERAGASCLTAQIAGLDHLLAVLFLPTNVHVHEMDDTDITGKYSQV